MVLHLGGCGRVGHRHNTLRVGPGTIVPGPTLLRIPSHRRAHHTQTFNTGATVCLRSKLLVELDDAIGTHPIFHLRSYL